MSLTKPLHKKPTMQQKRRSAGHHQKSKEYHKAYWPYLPILVVILAGFFINGIWMKTGVLDYATNTSPVGLLNGTNNERTANGLGALTLNTALNEAAQAKALDMVNRNYWSHNTPDGKEPWYFIANTGYKYQTAGENLAFGFPTSGDTVVAWMNSPGHRANILNNTYTEVGFGIANSASYQEYGNQTIVVAMYASPSAVLAAGNTADAQPIAPQASPAQNTPFPTTPAPADKPETLVAPVSENTDTVVASSTENRDANTAVAAAQKVSRVEVAFTGVGPWSVGAVVLLVVALASMLVMRHGLAWKKALVHGEQFILKHKVLDIIVVAVIVSGLLLVQTVGFIQ